MRAFFLSLLLIPSVYAYEIDGNKIILTPEEVSQCLAEGGCAVVTRKQAEEAFAEVFQEGLKAGAQSCKKTDWRKNTAHQDRKREGWDD